MAKCSEVLEWFSWEVTTETQRHGREEGKGSKGAGIGEHKEPFGV